MKNFDLQWVRENAGLSITEAAALLGVHRETFSRWENGIAATPPHRYKALLARTGANIAEVAAAAAALGPRPENMAETRKPKPAPLKPTTVDAQHKYPAVFNEKGPYAGKWVVVDVEEGEVYYSYHAFTAVQARQKYMVLRDYIKESLGRKEWERYVDEAWRPYYHEVYVKRKSRWSTAFEPDPEKRKAGWIKEREANDVADMEVLFTWFNAQDFDLI